MADPVFGISIRKVDEGARPVLAADLSTIGIVGPAPLADPTLFPLDTPVFLNSNDTNKTRKIGESRLSSSDAVRGINDQLGETQFAARIVIVRTAEGTDPDPAIKLQQTISKIAGDSLNGTGMWAFLKSAQKLGFTPRILPRARLYLADGQRRRPDRAHDAGRGLRHRSSLSGGVFWWRTGRGAGDWPCVWSQQRLNSVRSSLNCPARGTTRRRPLRHRRPATRRTAAVKSAGGIGYGVGEQLMLR